MSEENLSPEDFAKFAEIVESFRQQVEVLNEGIRRSSEASQEAHQKLREAMHDMERDLRAAIHEVEKHLIKQDGEEVKAKIEKLENQVSELEKGKSALIGWIVGGGLTAGTAAGGLISYLTGG